MYGHLVYTLEARPFGMHATLRRERQYKAVLSESQVLEHVLEILSCLTRTLPALQSLTQRSTSMPRVHMREQVSRISYALGKSAIRTARDSVDLITTAGIAKHPLICHQ